MSESDPRETKSKSQIKREFLAMQGLAQRLVALTDSQAARLPLPDDVRDAVTAARALQRGALKRQLKFIGGLLAAHGDPSIEHALTELHRPHVRDVRAFHEVEQWRDALIAGDDAPVDAVVARHPGVDRQRLMQLVRTARREHERAGGPRASRALFRFLMALREEI